MTDELRPPLEFAHLPWHFLNHPKIDGAPDTFVAKYISKRQVWRIGEGRYVQPATASMYGWTYNAPAIPLPTGEDAVERIAWIVAREAPEKTEGYWPLYVDQVRAVLAAIAKGE
jgi:hypothetical protein